MRASRKDIKAFVKQAEKQGWSVDATGSNHFRFRPPDGETTIIVAGTPRCEGDRNYRALLRRAGLQI